MNNHFATEPAEKLVHALAPFFVLRERLPARSIQVLLLVAAHEGETVGDFSRRAAVPNSSMSRLLLDLGPRARDGTEGMGLLVRRGDPANFLKAQYFLTPKGRALVNKVLKHV